MIFIIVLIIIILLGAIISFGYLNSKEKFTNLEIKLKEADNHLDIYIEKKIELIDRLIKHMKKKKIKAEFPNVEKYKQEKIEKEKLHSILFDTYTEIIQIVDENEDKLGDEKSISLLDQLSDNEDDLIATVKYYNDNATDFNYLFFHFPTSFFRHFMSYHELELYRNEKRETFEILKEK